MSTYNFSGLNIISGTTITNLNVGGSTSSSLEVSGTSRFQGITSTSLRIGGRILDLSANFTTTGTGSLTFTTTGTTILTLPTSGLLLNVPSNSNTYIMYREPSFGFLGGSPSLTWSATASQLQVGNSTAGTIALGDGLITKNAGSGFVISSGLAALNTNGNFGTSGIPWDFMYGSNIVSTAATTSDLLVTGVSTLQSTTTSSLYSNSNSIINGRLGCQSSYSIISLVNVTAATSGYVATCTYQTTGSSFSVTGTGVTSSVTASKYNGATGTSVTIDQRSNYLLSINGSGPSQTLGALYYVQTANDNTGAGIYTIGTNGNYGNVSVAVSSNAGFSGGSGTIFVRATITATTSSIGTYNYTITFTQIGRII